MTVVCPWGNTFHLYDISIDDDINLRKSDGDDSKSTQKMVNLHSQGGAYGPHRMAVRGKPGIRYVEIACRMGTASSIAGFYEKLLGCNVARRKITKLDNSEEVEAAVISVGPGVHMTYVENSHLTEDILQQMNGVHACIYIPHYQMTYQTLKRHNLIWTNPRFTHLDSCDTWEEAYASRTFRFKDILNLATGQKVMEFEHETRPMMHGQYMKVPSYFEMK